MSRRRDFRYYLTGQALSALGSSFTNFAIPLMVFRLTGSPTALGVATAVAYLPYLLFGFILGAFVDRTNRKRLMIYIEATRALILALLAIVGLVGDLRVVLLYGTSFLLTTLRIAFDAGRFAAVASLVPREELVSANGRIESILAITRVAGPALAGTAVTVLPLASAFAVDAGSYVVSMASLVLIRSAFNESREGAGAKRPRDVVRTTLRDARDGIRYVLSNPLLRAISFMMVLVNLVDSTALAQLVLFAKRALLATDGEVAWLTACGGLGVSVLALTARRLRSRFSFSQVAIGSQIAAGVLTCVLGLIHWYPAALVLWSMVSGLGVLFNINTTSLRQEIVPDEMRGRAMTVAAVFAWTAVPVGALLGGYVTAKVGDVATVYVGIGVVTALIGVAFIPTTLGRAERYLTATPVPSAVATRE